MRRLQPRMLVRISFATLQFGYNETALCRDPLISFLFSCSLPCSFFSFSFFPPFFISPSQTLAVDVLTFSCTLFHFSPYLTLVVEADEVFLTFCKFSFAAVYDGVPHFLFFFFWSGEFFCFHSGIYFYWNSGVYFSFHLTYFTQHTERDGCLCVVM